ILKDFEPFHWFADEDPTHFKKMVDLGTLLTLKESRGLLMIEINNGTVIMPKRPETNDEKTLRTVLERDQQPFDKPAVPMANILSDRRGTVVVVSLSSNFTTDLWPILSMTKISPCFFDILIPSVQHHYKTPISSIKPEYLSNVPWFTRFQLVDIARDHTSIISAKIDTFDETACAAADCDRDVIIEEYDIGGVLNPPEHIYQHKYVLDLDGNTSSKRYLELLRSGSLVFKGLNAVMSDLVSKIQWAIENDFEAQAIQQRGLEIA
ncbi:hypothetical protein C8J57DRAFT_1342235, partial [Mycena rebaudengoi]